MSAQCVKRLTLKKMQLLASVERIGEVRHYSSYTEHGFFFVQMTSLHSVSKVPKKPFEIIAHVKLQKVDNESPVRSLNEGFTFKKEKLKKLLFC